MSPTNLLLLGAAALFALYNFWRFFQVRSRRHRHGSQKVGALREKVKAARVAAEAGDKAALFVDAGDLAKSDLRDPDLAVGYYLRALRADPGSARALSALRATLARPASFRRLERIYWRLLSRISPAGSGRETYLEVWRALGDLYGRRYRHPARARAIRQVVDALARRDQP